MSEHVRGPSYARTDAASFEFKPSATGYTGGGYARWRSRERRAHTPGAGTDDVFVSVHRLAAVVWCYDSDEPLADVLADLADKDVHHRLGFPSANGEAFIEVRDHGGHSSITQTQKRAFAESAKRDAEREATRRACEACGATEGTFARVDGATFCLECASDRPTSGQIEIL